MMVIAPFTMASVNAGPFRRAKCFYLLYLLKRTCCEAGQRPASTKE